MIDNKFETSRIYRNDALRKMRLNCAYASKYKGVIQPKCGCQKCNLIWYNVRLVEEVTETGRKMLRNIIEDLEKSLGEKNE